MGRRSRFAAAGVGMLLTVPIAAPAQADSVRDSMWYLSTLRIAEVHAIAQGEGMTIAVLDGGVDANNPDLAGAVLPGIDGWTAGKDGRVDDDPVLHGTGVATLIAGRGHGPGNADGILGIAPKAQVLPVGVWPPGSTDVRPDNISIGIRWAVDQGAAVICIAGGGAGDDEMRQAIKYATEKNVPVVAAVGNAPDKLVRYPAADRRAFGIGAVERGDRIWPKSVAGPQVAFTAPGADMTVPKRGGGYTTVNGTSTATAIFAGTLLLVRQRFPRLTVQQLYDRMKATAVDRGPPGADDQYGWGVLDPVAALTATVEGEPAATPTTTPTTTPSASQPNAGGPKDGDGITVAVFAGAGFAVVFVVVVAFLARRRRTA